MLLAKNRLLELLEHLSTQARVYVPARLEVASLAGESTDSGTLSHFVQYAAGVQPDFELVNTTLPPKDMLFPQTQKMYRYGFDTDGVPYIDPIHDADEVVVFGLRSCDMASIDCMDQVFLTKGYEDEFYAPRRQKLLCVALACGQAAESCFCDSMGIDPNVAANADIQLVAGDEAFSLSAQTEKGQAALSQWQAFLSAGELPVAPAPTSCSLKVEANGLKDKLEQMYEHPLWEQISKKCLTCGTCTFVCPTCHCFDISQSNRMQMGERFRSWDSCMFFDYTEMAGHHNPRAAKMPRVRQRFMHKLCFFEERYGCSLCVGCGRCVAQCPVALDITVLIDQIGAAPLDEKQDVEGAVHAG
ncbi:MAG: 4Fe-4S dicluster domain-containing protein [Actinomycetia bacterium]|nr:4Fe-4S dicluster domain-containing protein [Actinomycetes bacterium]